MLPFISNWIVFFSLLLHVLLVLTASVLAGFSWYHCARLRRELLARTTFEIYLARRAFIDPLTQLPNRAVLLDRLTHALARSDRHGNSIALLFLDLDRFKWVNDTYGHPTGDAVLANIGTRLAHCLRQADTLARFGGDEFAILLEDVPDRETVAAVAERVLACLRRPFTVAGTEVIMTGSIGICFGGSTLHAAEVLRDADIALYQAKARGRDCSTVFDDPSTRGIATGTDPASQSRHPSERPGPAKALPA